MNTSIRIGEKEVKIWQVVVLVILLIAVPVGVYLAQTTQIFKPRASGEPGAWVNAFELKDSTGKPITCDISKDPPECTTETVDVSIKVVDPSKLQ